MRVSIFDRLDDGRIVFRAEDGLAAIMPEPDEAYHDACLALIRDGQVTIGGGAAPLLLLVCLDDIRTEPRVLRGVIARRAAVGSSVAELHRALIQAEHTGCPLRLRDLAAADDADLMHDIIGIWNHRDPATGRVDLAVFRPRFIDVDRLPKAEPHRPGASPQVAATDRMDLHRSRLSLEALAQGAALPWRVDDSDAAEDGSVVVRCAEGGYVCELDFAEFDGPADAAERQARALAQLIAAAMLGRVANEPLDAEMAAADIADADMAAAAAGPAGAPR